MTFLRDIGQLFIMIIHLLRQLLQNLGQTPHFAFPPSSRIGNTLIFGTVSLSVGLKSANLFLIWLFYSCSQVSCLDVFFFFSSMFKIQICITLGTLGKVWDAKRHHKTMQNVGKPRTRGWMESVPAQGNRSEAGKGRQAVAPDFPAGCALSCLSLYSF